MKIKKASNIDALAADYLASREASQEAQAKLKAAQEKLTAALVEIDGSTIRHGDHKISLISPTRRTTDWDSIAEELSEDELDVVTVRVIDPKKFEAAAQLGIVPADLVEENTTVTKTAPYLKVQ